MLWFCLLITFKIIPDWLHHSLSADTIECTRHCQLTHCKLHDSLSADTLYDATVSGIPHCQLDCNVVSWKLEMFFSAPFQHLLSAPRSPGKPHKPGWVRSLSPCTLHNNSHYTIQSTWLAKVTWPTFLLNRFIYYNNLFLQHGISVLVIVYNHTVK